MFNRRIFSLIQIIASIAFLITMITSGLFPVKYIIIFIIIFVVLVILFDKMMKPKKVLVAAPRHARGYKKVKKNGKRQLVGRVLTLLVSIFLFVGCFYIHTGSSTIATLTSSDNTITTRYNLYTLKSKGYNSVSDLENKTIANAGSFDSTDFNTASKALQKKISYQAKAFTSYQQMENALYNGEVDAILMNGYYETMMKKYHANFVNDVSAVWYTEMKETASSTAAAKDFSKDTFTIYLSGVDSRGGVTKTSRSDSNILVTINPKTKQILMTSIPRDYYVNFAMAQGAKDKLTHAALFGTINSMRTIEKFMGIKIDFYCRVNFEALVKIVDALDGIKVYSDKAFTPWTNHSVRIKKGWQTMDGKTALAFARERKTYTEGDRHRAANQQAVMKAIIKKMESPKILTNFSQLMSAITGLFQTDISTAQLRQLVNYQLDNNVSWTFSQSVLKGTSQKQLGGLLMPNTAIYYMTPDTKSILENATYITDMQAGKKITVSSDSSLASETDET